MTTPRTEEVVIDDGAAAEAAPLPVDLSSYEVTPPSVEFVQVNEAAVFERRIRGRQEWVRTALAVGAFLSLVAILVVMLLAVIDDATTENIDKISTVVVTPLTGIVGTIIGFYFAEKRGGNN